MSDNEPKESPNVWTKAKDKAETHPLAVLGTLALICATAGGGAVLWLAGERAELVDKAHAIEVERLQLEKLQASPLSTPEAPGAADAITRWIKSADARERIDALRIIGGNRNGEPFFVPVVVALLDDPDARVRATAVTALGMMQDKAGVIGERIAPSVDDKDAGVRKAAAVALGIGWQGTPPEAFPSLERTFLSPQESMRTRVYAARAMLVVDDERARPIIDRPLEYPIGSDPRLRCAAVFALVHRVMTAGGFDAGGLEERQHTFARDAFHVCVDELVDYLRDEDPRLALMGGDVGPFLLTPLPEMTVFADRRFAEALSAAAKDAPRGRVRSTLESKAAEMNGYLDAVAREAAQKAKTSGP